MVTKKCLTQNLKMKYFRKSNLREVLQFSQFGPMGQLSTWVACDFRPTFYAHFNAISTKLMKGIVLEIFRKLCFLTCDSAKSTQNIKSPIAQPIFVRSNSPLACHLSLWYSSKWEPKLSDPRQWPKSLVSMAWNPPKELLQKFKRGVSKISMKFSHA